MPHRVNRPSNAPRRVQKIERPPHTPAILPIHDSCAGELRAFHAKYPPAHLPRMLKEAIEALRDVSKDFALNRNEIVFDQNRERDDDVEQQVAELGKLVEKNVRGLVDLDAELQRMKTVLQEISNSGRGGGDGVQPVEEYMRRTAAARRAYMRKDLKERYANVADYIDYRTVVHAVSDPTAPVPQRKDWFKKPLFKCDATAEITDEEPLSDSEDDGGNSGPSRRNRDVEMSNADDSDDDIEETSATRNLKCPLTMRRFENPVKAACQHSFELEAIKGMLKDYKRMGKAAVCPVPGCGKAIKVSELKEDVVMKSLVEAEIRREQMEEERAMMGSGDEDDEEEAPVRPKGKGKAVASRQSMRAEEELPYGDDEGEGGEGEGEDEDEDEEMEDGGDEEGEDDDDDEEEEEGEEDDE
ncbi:hypothetical protein TWF696_004139 [Orbilia brochopaga]|uniref:SP-RING-type domain-containing protein n=1 Tax=Orbilia brochopaga TaxID=3140254 RepID=A0AAV9V591_9PEZI